MLKKTITYIDFNGVERTEDFYFHLTEAEIADMEIDSEGGLEAKLQKIIDSKDIKKIKKYFQDIVFKAYGEKSEDGKRFIKSEELSKDFSYTQAYSDLWLELLTNEGAAVEFVTGIMPRSIAKKARTENPELFNKVDR